ncbi:MAG: ATP-dependent Clp protease proteolytic subunit [Sediminibacterium sp.]|nr:ATP-dependent Clp protease proteolytic subunit [Sediminibacterium sp.]
MPNTKYIVNPYLMNDDDDEPENEPKKDDKKDEAVTSFIDKRLEKLFFEKRAVYLWGVVDDKSAREIVTKLLLLDADKNEEIKFYINSPGGVVTSGMVIYDTMQLIDSPVSTVCMGLAASMGSILLSAGTKGKRFVYPHGEVMIHQPSLGGYYQATSADIEIQANQIIKTKQIGARILSENCGKTVEQVMKDFNRDYWMNAEEAVNYGIVDAVLTKI